jgi:excisionase family DNA binding protein
MFQTEARARAIRTLACDPLLPLAEVAALLGCYITTVRRLIDAKKLNVVRLSARRIGIRQSVIEKYITDNETT